MGIQAPAIVKYRLIQEALRLDDNRLNISCLCQVANVSRSGYYRWVETAPLRQLREESDEQDFLLVKNAFEYRGYKKGARSIYMRLLHLDPPVVMNLKKIRRLMAKYELYCPIRQPNPYRRMARAMRTSIIADNVIQRRFKSFRPRKALLTDITYIFYSCGVCYLSTILDACTHEVLAYELSESLQVEFVIMTVEQLVAEHGAELDDRIIVHSDQGCHYTSRAFIEKLKDLSFVQSMSRKGNCWDNAPQESFFGHMKDEIKDVIKECKTYTEVVARVDDWMDYYNNDRYQWDLQKLSPKEFYKYLMTGVYPLKSGVSKSSANRGSAPGPEV